MGRSGNDAISAYRFLGALASVNNGGVNKEAKGYISSIPSEYVTESELESTCKILR